MLVLRRLILRISGISDQREFEPFTGKAGLVARRTLVTTVLADIAFLQEHRVFLRENIIVLLSQIHHTNHSARDGLSSEKIKTF